MTGATAATGECRGCHDGLRRFAAAPLPPRRARPADLTQCTPLLVGECRCGRIGGPRLGKAGTLRRQGVRAQDADLADDRSSVALDALEEPGESEGRDLR